MARDRSEPSRTRYGQPPGNFASSGQLVDVLDDGSLVLADVKGIDFGSNLSVTDNGDGTVTVSASASGGGFVTDPAFDIENQTFTDQGMSDDFADGSLAAQWTAVDISAGTISPFSEPTGIIYEERQDRGLFMQAASGAGNGGLRLDDMLVDGEEIIIACAPGPPNSDANNDHQIKVTLNDDDTGIISGTAVQIYFDGTDNGNIKLFDFGAGSVIGQAFDSGASARRIYFRITHLNGQLYFLYSPSGLAWEYIGSWSTPNDFDNIWIGLRHNGTTNTDAWAIAQFFWVRHAATNGGHDPFQV